MPALMSHLVAGFPNEEIALLAAESLIESGATFLEIQLPFSDPSADGKDIANACTQTLLNGFKTQQAFDFIQKIHQKYPFIQLAIMSYASLVFTPGIAHFCQQAQQAGVGFLIVPDLPFDCDENLRQIALQHRIQMIPVAAPSMSCNRINLLLKQNFPIIYAALRRGITGNQTQITQETQNFLKHLKQNHAQILGGFGVSDRTTVQSVAPFVDYVVAGSIFVRIIEQHQNDLKLLQKLLKEKAQELCLE